MKCPQCKTADIMGKGYLATGLCRGCYQRQDEALGNLPSGSPTVTDGGPATTHTAILDDSVQSTPTIIEALPLTPTGFCPGCGIKIRPMTSAETQARYRQRKQQ